MVVVEESNYLAHYGILRKSGRYPWGSGKDVPTRNQSFLDTIDGLRKQGLSNKEIAQSFEMSTTELNDLRAVSKARQKQWQVEQVWRLTDKGLSNGKIAEVMGLPGESSVRAIKAPGVKERAEVITSTADMLKREVEDKKFVDVGTGVENHLNISKEKLRASVALLKHEGYNVYPAKFPQAGTTHDTQMKVLVAPGVSFGDVQRNKLNVQQIKAVSPDGGKSWDDGVVHPFVSIHPSRLEVRYKEDGGDRSDGVIYVREGVPDVSLGKSRYAQVRVKVGDSHYIKGMAIYRDDLPPGIDLVFNTVKSKADVGNNKLDALKGLEPDPAFPFKTVVRQIKENPGSKDPAHPEKVVSAMNIVSEEGKWSEWSQSLASQFLSKQNPSLAREQLTKTFDRRQREFDSINSLTNPAVKKKLMDSFAESTDAAAVHLNAAELHSRQRWHVILPVESMPESQVYAPNYPNGTTVALVRYPHAGTFEIPILTVNNHHPEAVKLLGNKAPDAIGINHKVAEHLSGADFDGDTVIVIPNNQNKVKISPPLERLKGFDPRTEYKKYEGMPVISVVRKNHEMGNISNLITDMTLKGASADKLARAVRHSMVIIDSEKHELDWKKSELDHGIAALKLEYQGGERRGAATLISRAGSEKRIPERKLRLASEGGPVDPVTGRKVFVNTDRKRTVVDKKGNVHEIDATNKVKKLEVTDNAHDLVSDLGTRMEKIYADHSNSLKDLANKARLASLNTPPIKQSPSAKRTYDTEVKSLNAKLHIAEMNAPLERRAQLIAATELNARKVANPNLDGDALKKVKFRELEVARNRIGAGKIRVEITQKEWDAIQSGAISNSKLVRILNNTDLEKVRKLAAPKAQSVLTTALTSRARQLLDSGHTRSEVADQLGVSLSTLDRSMADTQGGGA
ncbi:MAG TPA: helix-turn-helix domain-containing protein [Patescibacteria group bacterium]|nr:helix-turn-helix domain-containing protein [Patescibacteria group bacterium]